MTILAAPIVAPSFATISTRWATSDLLPEQWRRARTRTGCDFSFCDPFLQSGISNYAASLSIFLTKSKAVSTTPEVQLK